MHGGKLHQPFRQGMATEANGSEGVSSLRGLFYGVGFSGLRAAYVIQRTRSAEPTAGTALAALWFDPTGPGEGLARTVPTDVFRPVWAGELDLCCHVDLCCRV